MIFTEHLGEAMSVSDLNTRHIEDALNLIVGMPGSGNSRKKARALGSLAALVSRCATAERSYKLTCDALGSAVEKLTAAEARCAELQTSLDIMDENFVTQAKEFYRAEARCAELERERERQQSFKERYRIALRLSLCERSRLEVQVERLTRALEAVVDHMTGRRFNTNILRDTEAALAAAPVEPREDGEAVSDHDKLLRRCEGMVGEYRSYLAEIRGDTRGPDRLLKDIVKELRESSSNCVCGLPQGNHRC
jgi:hypothetical protein